MDLIGMNSLLLRCFVGAALVAGGLQASLAGAQTLTSTNGTVLPIPPIEDLSCDQVLELMHTYSASGYREIGMIPSSGTDLDLLDYEDSLATAHYDRCHLGQNDFSSPSETFGKGFN